MTVIKIKSTHKQSQGDYVLIEEENFDAKIHTLYEEVSKSQAKRIDAQKTED